MQCIFHQTAEEFLAASEMQLMLNESENSLILGLLNRITDRTIEPATPLYVSVTHCGEFLGHGLQTSPQTPLDLSRMSTEAAQCLAQTLFSRNLAFKKIVGESETCHQFTAAWMQLTGCSIKRTMSQGIYELRRVVMPDLAGGKLKEATDTDLDVVSEFLDGFFTELGAPTDDVSKRVQFIVDRDLSQGNIGLWEDETGQVVSMAARVRETKNGVSISYVYTPPRHRRRGHAGRVVACLSQQLLESGKQMCNLYTDMENPTSNNVYQKIGYQLIAHGAELTLSAVDAD